MPEGAQAEWPALIEAFLAAWTVTTGLLMRMGDGETVDPDEIEAARRDELEALLSVLTAPVAQGDGDAPDTVRRPGPGDQSSAP